MTIYNPHQLTRQELIDGFVARKPLLDELVDDLRRGGAQHHLLIGDRGSGKTTLLLRLATAIDDDPKLAKRCIPLRFPEEQYNITSLADLWLNALDALVDAYEHRGEHERAKKLEVEAAVLDQLEPNERASRALSLLLAHAKKAKRLVTLLIDNLDLVFERLGDSRWAFREVLSADNGLVLIGASSKAIEDVATYESAFYDFFRIHHLDALPEDEAKAVVVALAEKAGTPQVAEALARDPGRFKALYILTGGTPRTLAMLHTILASDFGERGIERDLDRLLDQVTPYYKARLDDLPNQAQVIVDAVALQWDPLTAADVAKHTGLDVNLVSAQLNRLVKNGSLERVVLPDAAKLGFQIRERFFNIWYLMRASRRVRKYLARFVRFLRVFYGDADLDRRADALLEKSYTDSNPADLLAFASTVSDSTLRMRLELRAVGQLVRSNYESRALRELLDLDGDDAHLVPAIARARMLRDVTKRVAAWNITWPDGVTATHAADIVAGDRWMSAREKVELVDAALNKSGMTGAAIEDLVRNDRLAPWPQPRLTSAIAAGEASAYPELRTAEELDQLWRLADDRAELIVGVVVANSVRGRRLSPEVLAKLIDLDRLAHGAMLNSADMALLTNGDWGTAAHLVRAVLSHPNLELARSTELVVFFQTCISQGFRVQLDALLDEPGLADRIMPLREGLAAFDEPQHLDRLAPEIRVVASDVLALLRSKRALARPAASGVSPSRRRR